MEIRDWRGTELTVGSKIVYATGSRSSMTMVEAEVLEIRPREKVDRWGPKQRTYSLIVRPVDSHNTNVASRGRKFVWDDRDAEDPKDRWHYEDVPVKPVALTAVERVTVIG